MRLFLPLSIVLAVALGCASPNDRTASNTNATPTPTPTPKRTLEQLTSRANSILETPKEQYENWNLSDLDEVMNGLKEVEAGSKEKKKADQLLKKVQNKSAEIAAERVLLGPKPQQSEWDGSVVPVKDYLRRNLNDYDSSEFVEWSPISKTYIGKEPYWGVRLRLRAKNAFGAYIVRDTYYFIRNEQVDLARGLD